MKWLSPALGIVGVAVLVACADAPRVAAPRIAVETVRLERITGTEATFEVMLNLSNPNAREIAVNAVDANLTIEDVPVGSATLVSPLRLPANGETTAAVQARAGISAVLRVAAEIRAAGAGAKGYRPTRAAPLCGFRNRHRSKAAGPSRSRAAPNS